MELITGFLVLILSLILLERLLFGSAESKRIAKYLDRLPGPPKLPIIGNMKEFIGIKREQIYDTVTKRNETYGPIFRIWVGSHPTVMLTKADYFEKIMSSQEHIYKTTIYDNVKPWLGEGLLLSGGPKWHRNRKLLTPAFHFKILEQFVEIFSEKASELVNTISDKHGKQFDVYPYLNNCALNVICETSMGVQLNAIPEKSSAYVNAVHAITEQIIQRIMRPWLTSDFLFYKSQLGKDFQESLKILHGFTKKVIQDRKQNMKRKTKSDIVEEDELIGKKRRLAFLDILLEAGEDGNILTDEEIRAEVDNFMFAGHDTITTLMCWVLLLLGSHPEIQDKVRDEINSIFPDGHKLTISDLNEMKYMERVLKETLRLYPSAPTIGRLLKEDIVLGKYLIPAGVSVFMHINQAHRDPEYYDEPNKFDPDRFLPENSKGRHPYAFVPFSAGPRNCIGQKFAMYQGKTLLAWILKNYRVKAIEKPETVKIYKEIVMKPQNGLQVILEKIK